MTRVTAPGGAQWLIVLQLAWENSQIQAGSARRVRGRRGYGAMTIVANEEIVS